MGKITIFLVKDMHIDKLFTQKGIKLPPFLTRWRGTIFFLASVFIFATIFVLIYQPLNPPVSWSRQLYTTLLVGSGFVVLLLSRLLMHIIHKHHVLYLWQYVVWGVGEILVFIFGLALFAYLLGDAETFFSLVVRVTIDVAGILTVPYILTVLLFLLDHEKEENARLRAALESYRCPQKGTNEVLNFYDRGGRLALATRSENVLYIEADDNYCIIHYYTDEHEETFVLHNSMKYFDSWGSETGLLRCHRSYIVNMPNVKLLRKERDGLTLELYRGDRIIPVSRTYREGVLAVFAAHNATTM